MGKSLMKAGAIIAGAALIATGVGAAAGAGILGAQAAAVAGMAGGWTVFGVSIATLGQVGAGLTALGSLVTKRPSVGTGGSPVQQTYDPQAGIPYPVGRTAVAGRIIYGTTAPENNKYRLLYSILAGAGPIDGIEQFYANNEAVNFTADGGEGASGKYLNRMWQVRRLGAADDTALRFTATGSKDTPADHGGNPPEWTAEHRLSGYACAVTACEYDTKKFSGDVQPLWVLRGVKVYDPRQDDTYPGGHGGCRAGNESTYVYSENPWLHALTWAIGRFQNGKRVLGFGIPVSSLLVSQFVEAANVADANGWVIGGTVYSTDDKWAVMQAMAQAGGGYCVPMGAQIGCVVNAPRVSIGEVKSSDIVGPASAAGTKGRRDRINRVIPRYRSEDHNWETVSAAGIEVAEHIAFDGAQRTREVDYVLVQAVIQAAQLARYDIENSREFEPVVLTLGPAFLGYRAGDCLTANIPELGLVGQDLIILRRTFDPSSGAVTLECRSETFAKHAWCLGQTTTPPPTPSLTPGTLGPTAPNPDDWTAEGGVLASAEGELPVIIVRGILDNVHAVSVIVDYRQILDDGPPPVYGDWQSQEFPASSLAGEGEDPRVTLHITGLVPGGKYQVRVRYRTVRQITDPDVNTDLGPVVVGGVGSGGGAPDTVPPAAVSALAYEASLGTIFLSWTNPADADVDMVEVWASKTNDRATATRVGTPKVPPNGRSSWSHSGLNTGETWRYWLRAVDRDGNASTWFPASATAGFAATTESLFIDDFAAGIRPIGRGVLLPDPASYAGDLFFLTTNSRLYRKIGGTWEYATPASDISGQITRTQIGDGEVLTPKLGANAVTTSKLAFGAATGDIISVGAVQTSHLGALSVSTEKLAASSVVAAKVAAGTLTADRLVIQTIDSYYIKSGAIANSGAVDWSGNTLLTTSWQAVGYPLSIEMRGGSGSYTTIHAHLFVDAVNTDMVNDQGLWGAVSITGAVPSDIRDATGVPVQPGNPAQISIPIHMRFATTGYLTIVPVAFCNTGFTPALRVTKVKLVPVAIYNS